MHKKYCVCIGSGSFAVGRVVRLHYNFDFTFKYLAVVDFEKG